MMSFQKPLKQRWRARLMALLFVFFVAAPANAEDISSLRSYFKAEGDDPLAGADNDGVLSFSATRSQYKSGNGHGWRNEVKIRKDLRLPASQTHESFAATVTPHLPAWAKTIVAQYHFDGLKTALKVYVQDSTGGGMLDDGVEGNGVFDILARISKPDGKEGAYPLGTVKSGEPFDLKVNFDGGVVSVEATTKKWGHKKTPTITLPDNSRVVYFKFGDYLQAMNTKGKHTTKEDEWRAYYAAKGIDKSQIDFSDVRFVREDKVVTRE